VLGAKCWVLEALSTQHPARIILTGVTMLLAAAAVGAALVAGRRASRIAPVVAIREG